MPATARRPQRRCPVSVDGPFVVDIDATLIETYGLAKQGAREVMRTGRRGYHPILAVAAGTGAVLHARLRRGRSNDATGAPAFVTETLSRVRQAGITGEVVLRANTGSPTCSPPAARRMSGSPSARMIGRMRALIEGLEESAWTPVPYFEPGAAATELGWLAFDRGQRPRRGRRWRGAGTWVRLIVRCTPTPPGLRDAGQHELFPTLRLPVHHRPERRGGRARPLPPAHAEVELAIRDLKYGLGLNHLPSRSFAANHAWLVLQTLAHNLGRWTARLGDLARTAR